VVKSSGIIHARVDRRALKNKTNIVTYKGRGVTDTGIRTETTRSPRDGLERIYNKK